jgi:hypothetical protein
MKNAALLILVGLFASGGALSGCDAGDDPLENDPDEDAGLDDDPDPSDEEDAGSTPPPDDTCEDNEDDYPGEYHCNYKTTFVAKNCYEYASGVSKADAEAECAKHKQGGPGGLSTTNKVFGEGPCTLTTTGHCFTEKQLPCGREFTVSNFTGKNDCNPGINFTSAWGCSSMGNGEYTCYLEVIGS